MSGQVVRGAGGGEGELVGLAFEEVEAHADAAVVHFGAEDVQVEAVEEPGGGARRRLI